MYFQSLPTLLLLASCLPTIVKCQHHRQLRHAPSNDNRQSNDYIDPIIIDEPSTQSLDVPTLSPSPFHIPVEEDTSLTPTYAFTTTTTSYDDNNDDTPYPPLPLPISAFQSKMTPSLVHLYSAESSLQTTTTVPTSYPSSSDTIDGAPSKLSSTITSPTLNTSSSASTNKLFQQNEHLSFTTSLHSVSITDDDISASTEVVHCNSSSSKVQDTQIKPYP